MDDEQGQQQRGKRNVTRRRIWRAGIATGVLAILGAALIYGPRLASGKYHRAAIEQLASDAVGRPVTIGGPIVLTLVPEPQLQAKDVTIGGPDGAQISAAALRLDLAPIPLLLGRLRATRLALRRPDITLPWPLPDGVSAIAPPPWLASLHATVKDGTFRIGPLRIDHADLSIFTGGPRAVIAAGGSGSVDGLPATMTLHVNDTVSASPAPVTATLKLAEKGSAQLKFAGRLDHRSVLEGQLTGTLADSAVADLLPGLSHNAIIHFSGSLAASGRLISWHDVSATSGPYHLDGDAILALSPAPLLRLDARGRGLAIAGIAGVLSRIRYRLPVAATLNLDDVVAGKTNMPHADAVLIADRDKFNAQMFRATLPGEADLDFSGSILPRPAGQFTIRMPDPSATLAALRPAAPLLPAWPKALESLRARGRVSIGKTGEISLDDLTGAFTGGPAPSAFSGALRVSHSGDTARIAARLDFDSLILDSKAISGLAHTLSDAKPNVQGPILVSARRFIWQDRSGRQKKPRLIADDLLADMALRDKAEGGGLDVRLASLHIDRALLAGYGTWTPKGGAKAARIDFTGPDARRAFGSLAHAFGIGAGWSDMPALHHRFGVMIAAAGPAEALQTGIALHLGLLRGAMTPVIDLRTGSAAGALSLHAPNAAVLIRSLGGGTLLGERQGLDWPGPGSASLRASAFLDGDHIGLSDFVLSLGALTASGRLDLAMTGSQPHLSGRIAADTLALPEPDKLAALARAALSSPFRIDLPHLTASRVDRFGVTVASDAIFSLMMAQGRLAPTITIDLNEAQVAGGKLHGSAMLTGDSKGTLPTLSLRGHLDRADAGSIASLARDRGLALPVSAGTLDIGAQLNAKGSSCKAWLDSLTGSVTASGHQVGVDHIDLGQAGSALAAAVTPPHPIGTIATDHALRKALDEGATKFDLLGLTASIAGRTIKVDHAALTGANGAIEASGNVDLANDRVAISITAHPAIPGHKTSPALKLSLAGSALHPAARADVTDAVGWMAKRRQSGKAH